MLGKAECNELLNSSIVGGSGDKNLEWINVNSAGYKTKQWDLFRDKTAIEVAIWEGWIRGENSFDLKQAQVKQVGWAVKHFIKSV